MLFRIKFIKNLKLMFYYIHIPFCKRKCKYCKFASFAWIDGKIEEYLKYLKKEISESRPVSTKPRPVSVYFWGWTPSILSLKQIESIINEFWILDKNIEITLEMNPEHISLDYIKWLKKIWVNRLSIGIQSLNNKTLSEIWRCDFEAIKKWFDILNQWIIENVWLDFIIGLPYAEKWDIFKDISYVLENYDFIKHISIYMLEDWIYPKNWANISIKKEDYLEDYKAANMILEKFWFTRYEVSNFSKPGFECRHNLAYWNHSNYRWFWLSAASFVNWKRFANSSSFKNYYDQKLEYIEELLPSEINLEKIMFNLRTDWINKEFLNQKKVIEFINDWLLSEENWLIKPTLDWIWILDYVLSEIII